MSAGAVAYLCGSLVLGGGAVGAALILRKSAAELGSVLRDGSWRGYSFTASATWRPAAHPKAALNGHAPARAPERPAERPAIAPVPQDGDLPGRKAAAVLGVGHSTLRRHEQDWGIERSPRTGPRGEIWCDAGSVNRYLTERNGSAP